MVLVGVLLASIGGIATVTRAEAAPAAPTMRAASASASQLWTSKVTYGRYDATGHYPHFPMSSPAVGDVTGDGIPDVVVGGMDGFLRVYRADNGALQVSVPLEGPIQSSPVLVDLYGKGRPQVLVSSASTVPGDTSSVRVLFFSGTSVATLFQRTSSHPRLGPTMLQRPFFATPAVGDIDGDGELEIVAVNLDQHLYAWNLDGSQVFAPKFLYDTLLSSPTLVDWNHDGRAEIVFGGDMDNEHHAAPYPNARGLLWSVDGSGNVSPGYPLQIPDQVLWTAPTVADLDGDGSLDVIFGSGMNYPEPGGTRVYAYNLASRRPLAGFPVSVAGRAYSTPAVVPLNGVLTVLVGTGRGWLYSIRRDGGVRWRRCTARSACSETRQVAPPGQFYPDFLQVNPAVADIDGDGALEAIVTTEKDLKFYDLLSGTPENFVDGSTRDAPVTVAGAWPNAATPSIASVGGKATIFINGIENTSAQDVFGVGDTGFLQAWQTPHPLGSAPWATDKGNFARTGLVGTTAAPSPALRSFVAAAVRDFLGRSATEDEKRQGTLQIQSGFLTKGAYLQTMVNSDAWLGAVVTKFYTDTLGRQPDPGGKSYWIGVLRRRQLSVAQVASQFYASPEYYANLGGGTDRSWVANLYQVLLGRTADAGGLNYWVGLVPRLGRPAVAFSFYQSRESSETRVKSLYRSLLRREPDPGGLAYWAGLLPGQGDLALALNLASSAEYGGRAVSRFPDA